METQGGTSKVLYRYFGGLTYRGSYPFQAVGFLDLYMPSFSEIIKNNEVHEWPGNFL